MRLTAVVNNQILLNPGAVFGPILHLVIRRMHVTLRQPVTWLLNNPKTLWCSSAHGLSILRWTNGSWLPSKEYRVHTNLPGGWAGKTGVLGIADHDFFSIGDARIVNSQIFVYSWTMLSAGVLQQGMSGFKFTWLLSFTFSFDNAFWFRRSETVELCITIIWRTNLTRLATPEYTGHRDIWARVGAAQRFSLCRAYGDLFS